MHSLAGWLVPPFGPLNGLHEQALAAKQLTWEPYVLWTYFAAPVLPTIVQAWLLVGGEQSDASRAARKALAGIAVVCGWRAWIGYRFFQPGFNAFNLALTMAHLHSAITALELGFLHDGIVDPWMKKGRGRLQASLDLIMNTRLIFLGDIGLDKGNKPNALVTEPVIERHLAHLNHPGQTRFGAIARHLAWVAVLYIIDHTFFSFIKNPHNPCFAQLGQAGDDVIAKFVDSTVVRVPIVGEMTPFSLHLFVQFIIFIIIWATLCLCFHIAATLGLLAGWEVETWSVDLMQPPWWADSLTDLWGRRWHQCLRHHFIIASACVCRVLHLPQTRGTMVPLAFFFSALAHVLAGLSMTPVPSSWKVGAFFLLNGVGCILEGMFSAVTGRRVGGPFGRIWFLISLFATSKLLCEAWLDAGMAGSDLLPSPGPGHFIVAKILDVVQVYPRTP